MGKKDTVMMKLEEAQKLAQEWRRKKVWQCLMHALTSRFLQDCAFSKFFFHLTKSSWAILSASSPIATATSSGILYLIINCWSIISGFQAITGGKGTAYAEEIEKARKEALEGLKGEARKIGANGILALDFETSEVLEGFILVTAYGTAVKLRKNTK